MRKLFLLILAVFLSTVASNAQVAAKDVDVRKKTFDHVWQTVNDKHFDPTFGGVDWKRVRDNYEPRAMASKSDKEFHAVLNAMVAELRLSHFAILEPTAELALANSGHGLAGVELKMIDDEPVVFKVRSNSSAEKAGVKPGFKIISINQKPWTTLTKAVSASLEARKVGARLRSVYLEQTLESAINGKPETSVEIKALDGENAERDFSLKRDAFQGEMSEPLGFFPAQLTEFESRLLKDDIGYLSFNIWTVSQMPKLRATIRQFEKSPAIIIDLRGNPGGVGGMASGLAGILTSKQTTLGSMRMREGQMNFIAYPQANSFKGKVAILLDHGSASTSEVFAAGMQEQGIATLFGSTSAGAVLPSMFERLPTGAIFQYAFSDYRSPNNVLIEGKGVKPDHEVGHSRKSLLEGRDAQLEAALKWLNDNR